MNFFPQEAVKHVLQRALYDRSDRLLALCALPLYLAAIGKYGLKMVAALLLSVVIGAGVELVAWRLRKKTPDLFGYPAWILLPLVLPPVFPLWMTGVAVFFGVVIGAAFFGGHGRALASPVAIGWAFAALSFPFEFNLGWSLPFPGFFLGFTRYSAAVITTEHPLVYLRYRLPESLETLIRGAFPQPAGNAVPVLLLGVGLILLLLRAIDYRTCLAFFTTVLILNFSLNALFPDHIHPMTSLLVGNLMLAGLFILPDRRIAARTPAGRWIIGILTGIVAVVIRNFSSFPDGVFFAVLFANVFAAIIDEGVLHQTYKGGRS